MPGQSYFTKEELKTTKQSQPTNIIIFGKKKKKKKTNTKTKKEKRKKKKKEKSNIYLIAQNEGLKPVGWYKFPAFTH
jgi:hypothetical protein